MTTMDIINKINKYKDEIQLSGQFLMRYRITNKQLLGALTSYAKGVNPDAVIAMVDDSLKKDGREGIVFTTSCIYFSGTDTDAGYVSNAMVRYCDISDTQVTTNKMSDFNNILRLNVINLPYSYYDIDSMTIRKNVMKQMLDEIIEVIMEHQNKYEDDRYASLENIKNYLMSRDAFFGSIVDKIDAGETISRENLGITDGIGLTPLHYAILYLKEVGSYYLIVDDSMKLNKELYLDKQQYGIYNYCMAAVCAIKNENKGNGTQERFFDLCTHAEMFEADAKKQRRRELLEKVADGMINVGKALIDEAVSSTAESYNRALAMSESQISERIEAQQSKVDRISNSKNIDSYQKYIPEKDKLDKMKRAYDKKWGSSGAVTDDDSFDEYEDDQTYVDINGAMSDIASEVYEGTKKSEQMKNNLEDMILDHLRQCNDKIREYTHASENELDDPRVKVLLHLYRNPEELAKRVKASEQEKKILKMKNKYFLLPQYLIDEFPYLLQYVVKE